MNKCSNSGAYAFGVILLLAGSRAAFGGAQPGSLDSSFDPGTGVDQSVFAMVVQPGGSIVIGGDFTMVRGTPRKGIARLNSDGSLDSGFDPGSGPNDLVSAVAVQGDKIIIVGYFTNVSGTYQGYIARLNSNGSLDTNFNARAGADGPVVALAVQTDGRILLGGAFATVNYVSRTSIARLNSNGGLDMDFDPGTGVSSEAFSTVNSLVLQGDGKVVIGGVFSKVDDMPRNNIARLNANGSLDTGFVPNVGVAGAGLLAGVNALAIQSDDKILIGGDFTSVAGSPRTNIARLSAAGSVDMTFNPAAVADSAVSTVAVDNNGKILIGGFFSHVNGIARNYVARLDNAGGLDAGFDPGSGADDAVYVSALQSDRKVLIGGSFTRFAGVSRPGIARLKGDVVLTTPELVNLVQSNGVFSVSLATVNGENYFLEFKDSLTEGTWTELQTVAGDGTLRPLVDPSATGPQGFYRVRVE
jgi:uncharacterized delta-60 repeat protein